MGLKFSKKTRYNYLEAKLDLKGWKGPEAKHVTAFLWLHTQLIEVEASNSAVSLYSKHLNLYR